MISLPLYIGTRYIGSKRRNGFLGFVSFFALLGMVLGVFALVVVLSVMNGFDRELKTRILRVIPHAFVTQEGGITDWQAYAEQLSAQNTEVVGVSPFISGKALARYERGVRGVEVYGISPEHEPSVSIVSDHMLVGKLDELTPGKYDVILGSLLARYLGVHVGDKVTLTLPIVSVTPAGIFPRSKRFTVAGVFEVGAQLDESLLLLHIDDAKKLYRTNGDVHGLRLKYDNVFRAGEYSKTLQEQISADAKITEWSETQGSLFQAVKMEKTVVGVLLSIIIAVAAFNIITSLIMMVTEKRSDIAVLRTMGMSKSNIVLVFVAQGTLLGAIGIGVGSLTGIITALNLSKWILAIEEALGIYIFDPSVYFVSYLPSVWQWQDSAFIAGFAIILSFLATLYPAYRASQIEPAEALRYNI